MSEEPQNKTPLLAYAYGLASVVGGLYLLLKEGHSDAELLVGAGLVSGAPLPAIFSKTK